MLTDDNKMITSTFCVGYSLRFIQCNNFISIASQLVALLNERLLICTFPSMLCGLKNTVFCPINRSDKLDHYTPVAMDLLELT